jgi:hypothetical protein
VIAGRCCICKRTREVHLLGPWSVPKLHPKDTGIRLACQGDCSGELYRKVREHLRARAA